MKSVSKPKLFGYLLLNTTLSIIFLHFYYSPLEFTPKEDYILLKNNNETNEKQNSNDNNTMSPHIKAFPQLPVARVKEPDQNPGCNFRRLDPFDPNVMKYLDKRSNPGCKKIQRHYVRVAMNGKVTLVGGGDVQCFHQEIVRRKDSDNRVDFLEKQPLKDGMIIPYDFVWITCKRGEVTVHENLLALVHKRNGTIETSKRTPSVLMFGMDSLSSQNSLRTFQKVSAFLQSKLNTHLMRTHIKVGPNTAPNMLPILTGRLHTELKRSEGGYVDHWNWIWKEFAQRGYTTAYIEDKMRIETSFNKDTSGFRFPPTHHYMRPFYQAWGACKANSTIARVAKIHCVIDRHVSTVLLNSILDIMRTYKGTPTFILTFSGLTHNSLTQFRYFDKPYADMLETLYQEGLLDNTIVIGFADHGLRFGAFRTTWMGRIEDNMPWLSISLPDWMGKEYPNINESLSYNQDSITSHFDLHATLQDIAHARFSLNGSAFHSSIEKPLSMFKKIPRNRTCRAAGIADSYCPCFADVKVDVLDEEIRRAAADTVSVMNDYLKPTEGKCAVLRLESMEAFYTNTQGILLTKQEDERPDLRLQIKVQPSNGTFETLSKFNYQEKKYVLDGSIVRIDEYGDQGICFKDKHLEMFCFCQQ